MSSPLLFRFEVPKNLFTCIERFCYLIVAVRKGQKGGLELAGGKKYSLFEHPLKIFLIGLPVDAFALS